ncbi:MAG: circularly permuted type 2 ATP-grasp protein, partial [Betaproteobacteria bacterium]|nr:circularly permuted type 2 ATP-grasp protein [Betaproteobacteria bacterium]
MSRELLAEYPQSTDRYDELFEAAHTPRAHWKPVIDQLAAWPAERMRERVHAVASQVRENGVTYNVYADPQGADRPWELDLLPMIVPQEEWAAIEGAIAQRATLLNRILVDVYGEQRLLKEGALPPALLFGHAGFLRPCRAPRPERDVMLHVYAADIARSPDGRWWVIGDRTQAPSGAGYALENRIIISRTFPQLFRDLKVQHLADFFARLREALAHFAPQPEQGSPFTVLLTPGPHNETFFEHAYLARYLGLPLVEGSDLTVREGCVWLKTLSGLQRVHAILRRLDDDYCDPLELRSDSALGIAGLVDAVRRGNVLVANALGSTLLESGALLGFLPKLCQKLLGEPLRMPSVATWWCGEPAALAEVEANVHRLVIKGAFPQLRVEPMFGEDLDERGRKRVIAMLRSRPNDYVAQELVHLSQAPTWDRAHPRLLGRAIGLRGFACATPEGYIVMPGGL